MEYLIDKVNQEEAKRIKEIIDFFENNPTITEKNSDISDDLLGEFIKLIQKYIPSNKLSEIHKILMIMYQKWNISNYSSYPRNEANKDFAIYLKNIAFGERHEEIDRLENISKWNKEMNLKSRSPLFRMLRKIKSLFIFK